MEARDSEILYETNVKNSSKQNEEKETRAEIYDELEERRHANERKHANNCKEYSNWSNNILIITNYNSKYILSLCLLEIRIITKENMTCRELKQCYGENLALCCLKSVDTPIKGWNCEQYGEKGNNADYILEIIKKCN